MGKLAKLGTSLVGYQEPEQTELEDRIAEAPAKQDVVRDRERRRTTSRKPVSQARPLRKPSPGEGRSSNPDYSALKVYVPMVDRTAAARKWMDSGGSDMSELIEKLLKDYVRA